MGEVTVLDTVSGRDLLMPKPGAPLDTDTAPDMVLADTVVTVLALPAMEVTVLDTVSGRDLLMPDTVDTDVEAMVDTAVDMEVMVDVDTVDTVERDLLMPGTDVDSVDTEDTVDTEDMDTVDMLTESKFYTSINLLPFILISSHYTY